MLKKDVDIYKHIHVLYQHIHILCYQYEHIHIFFQHIHISKDVDMVKRDEDILNLVLPPPPQKKTYQTISNHINQQGYSILGAK